MSWPTIVTTTANHCFHAKATTVKCHNKKIAHLCLTHWPLISFCRQTQQRCSDGMTGKCSRIVERDCFFALLLQFFATTFSLNDA